MRTWQVVVLVVVIVVLLLALGAWWAARQRARKRSEHLRDRFGPEYEDTLRHAGSRRDAERELDEREQRRQAVQVRALDPVRAQQFAGEWQTVQSRFVDDPEGCVRQADELVTRVMDERGYPTGDHGRQYEDISVDHPDLAADYRAAHGIAGASRRGEATTEQLREAMVHYRSLFGRLLGDTSAPQDIAGEQRGARPTMPDPTTTDPTTTRDSMSDRARTTDLRGEQEPIDSYGASRLGRHERLPEDGRWDGREDGR
ncbi:MAG: hypothetical protein ACTHQ3_19250 [Motilibacteraceae bacterium]